MISKRLKVLAEYVSKDDILGDIGTDHGFIPIYLLEKNILEKMIASDLNEGPLDNAKKELKESGFLDKVDLRLGSGLKPYKPGEIDTAIIAGMGGNLIREILEMGSGHIKYLNKLILQPMHGVVELRRWLLENGYRIVDEDLIYEKNIFYEIIVAEKGEPQDYTEYDLEFGFYMLNKRPEISEQFLNMKIEKIEAIIKSISQHGSSMSKDRVNSLKKELNNYYEAKKCL